MMSCMWERQNHKGVRQHRNGNDHGQGARGLSLDNLCSGKEMTSVIVPRGGQFGTFWVHHGYNTCFTWQKTDITNCFGCEETD